MKIIKGSRKLMPENWSWAYRNSDIKGIIVEYTCPHGIGHDKGVHGCDGCCEVIFIKNEKRN
jgi:hypothetical protein